MSNLYRKEVYKTQLYKKNTDIFNTLDECHRALEELHEKLGQVGSVYDQDSAVSFYPNKFLPFDKRMTIGELREFARLAHAAVGALMNDFDGSNHFNTYKICFEEALRISIIGGNPKIRAYVEDYANRFGVENSPRFARKGM